MRSRDVHPATGRSLQMVCHRFRLAFYFEPCNSSGNAHNTSIAPCLAIDNIVVLLQTPCLRTELAHCQVGTILSHLSWAFLNNTS